MATHRGWIQRLRNLLPGAASAPSPPAPVPAPIVTQPAVADGRNNVIIQIQGDGNSVVENLPHLTLTRYLTRRQHSKLETDSLAPYSMTIPLLGRKPEMVELRDWLTSAKPIAIRVLAPSRTDLAYSIADREITRIESVAKNRNLSPRFLSHMAAYVTLCQGLERTAVEEAVEEEKMAEWNRRQM